MVCVPSIMQAAKFFNGQRIEQSLLVEHCTGITFATAKFEYITVMTFLHLINLSSDLHFNNSKHLLSVTTSANAYFMSNHSFVSTI